MHKGKTINFDSKRGYGFLRDDEGGPDVFVYYEEIDMPGFKELHKGDLVEFEIGKGPKGKPQAMNVRVVGRAE